MNDTLDLNAGLTQVLADGTNTYLYGLGRLAEQQGTASEYYLGDALGSVRQLTNNGGTVTLARNYEPFGKTSQTIGTAQTDYGFTGEFTDASGLIYLRARYYESVTGRFTTRDTFEGDVNTPASLNRFNYAHSNPVMNTDPSGQCVVPIVCTVLLGGAVGALTGAAIGAGMAKVTYDLAREGKCGCEGQQIISTYSEAEFVTKGAANGALFGALFGALSGAGLGGATLAALGGMGLSTYGVLNSAQRLIADPSNLCAWFDLTVSLLFLRTTTRLARGAFDTGYATGQWWGWNGIGGAPAPTQQVNGTGKTGSIRFYNPNDLSAVKIFVEYAKTIQQNRKLISIGDNWITIATLMDWRGRLFIYESGNKILGLMLVDPQPGKYVMSYLEGTGQGVGTALFKYAIQDSMNRGYGGAIWGEPAAQSLNFYLRFPGIKEVDGTWYLPPGPALRILRTP